MKKSKLLTAIFAMALSIAMVLCMAVPTFAIDNLDKVSKDDAYVIGRKTIYLKDHVEDAKNPIGNAMSDNLVDKKMMLETVKGKYYVTFSMVGVTFSKDFKVEIMDKNGEFREVTDFKVTYQSDQSLGTQHYRVEVQPDDQAICPSLFVLAMGRRVQFSIKPDLSNATPGCGPFVTEFYKNKGYEQETQKDMSGFINMIPNSGSINKDTDTNEMTTTPVANNKKPTKAVTTTKKAVTTTETTTVATTVETTTEMTTAETTTAVAEEGMSKGKKIGIGVGVTVAVLAIGGGIAGVIIYKKKSDEVE